MLEKTSHPDSCHTQQPPPPFNDCVPDKTASADSSSVYFFHTFQKRTLGHCFFLPARRPLSQILKEKALILWNINKLLPT